MWLDNSDVHTKFIFDLEFVGDIQGDVRNCRIWEIGCVCLSTGHPFNTIVSPMTTRSALTCSKNGVIPANVDEIDKRGVPIGEALRQWCTWIHECCGANKIASALLMSHNCFKSDLLVLMCEMGRLNLIFAGPVLFFDTLPFIRYALRSERRTSFSLKDLCTEPCSQTHRAVDDCFRLSSVLLRCPSQISGIATTFGSIPLIAIDGIGPRTCMDLYKNGYYCVRQLLELISRHHGSTSAIACTEYLHSVQTAARCGYPLFVCTTTTAHSVSAFCTRMGW